VYIRPVKVPGGVDEGYFQLMRSYRQGGAVKKEVLVHLGPYWDTEDALKCWRAQCRELESLHRPLQAQKLGAKCERLAELTRADTDDPQHVQYPFWR
jgi:hypothetical protein